MAGFGIPSELQLNHDVDIRIGNKVFSLGILVAIALVLAALAIGMGGKKR